MLANAKKEKEDRYVLDKPETATPLGAIQKNVLGLDPKLKAAGLGLVLLANAIHSGPAHALDVFDEDNDWIKNFNVDVGGFEIDHRVLVEGVVGGQFIGFIGALVGGRAAKKRKDEVEKLAMQLKEVNQKLRARARNLQKKTVEQKDSRDPLFERIFGYLRMGKRTLKEGNGESALTAFKKAMEAIEEAKQSNTFTDFRAERKAHRGMGAAYMLLGNPAAALKHMNDVVSISIRSGDTSGLGDAYGVIADIYTEMDDYENAADFYDKYIEAINTDMDNDEISLEELEDDLEGDHHELQTVDL